MIDLLRKRSTVRSYTAEPIDQAAVDTLLEALLRSPSSRSNRPWEFIVVDDRGLLAGLSAVKEHGSSFLENAQLGIIVCADESKSDVWVEDCAIAAILVQMTAESLGLGSCWIQIRKRQHDDVSSAEEYIRELLGVPDRLRVASIIAIGHPAEKLEGLPAEELDFSKIRHNRYSDPWPRIPR
jgi:nitroreductase